MSTQLSSRLERLRSELARIEEGGIEPSEEARYTAVRTGISQLQQRIQDQGGLPESGETNVGTDSADVPRDEQRQQALSPAEESESSRIDVSKNPQSKQGATIDAVPSDDESADGQCGPMNDLDRRDPADPRFWDDVRRDTRLLLQGWLSGQLLNALTEFETHMQSESGDSSDGAVVIRVLMQGLSLSPVGAGVDLASKIVGIVATALTFGGTASPRVRYNDFVSGLHRRISELERSIQNGSHEAIQHLSELESNETEQNRIETRRSALEQLNSAACQLPRRTSLLRNMVTAWIDGAEDTPFEWDPWWTTHDAGYIYCVAHLMWGPTRTTSEVLTTPSVMLFNRKTAHIDDVPNQPGTIEAVRQAFGADTYLDMLPIPMTIEVQYTGGTERRTERYVKNGRNREHRRGWNVVSGSDNWMRAFLNHPLRPKVSDLREG